MNVSSCRSCGADIVWFETAAGKKMPVDVETVEPGDRVFESGHHVSHFATCPNASQHRKAKEKKS